MLVGQEDLSCIKFRTATSCRLVVIAADISPLDVISHLPVFCEEKSVPYMFVASKVRE